MKLHYIYIYKYFYDIVALKLFMSSQTNRQIIHFFKNNVTDIPSIFEFDK